MRNVRIVTANRAILYLAFMKKVLSILLLLLCCELSATAQVQKWDALRKDKLVGTVWTKAYSVDILVVTYMQPETGAIDKIEVGDTTKLILHVDEVLAVNSNDTMYDFHAKCTDQDNKECRVGFAFKKYGSNKIRSAFLAVDYLGSVLTQISYELKPVDQ